MIMAEYINREEAIEAAKHAWAKGLEPSQYLEIIPEADVAPVRHGRWEVSEFGYLVCTHCGWVRCGIPLFEYYPHCPNCGAKMDGGAE